jgi:hypothetical protein
VQIDGGPGVRSVDKSDDKYDDDGMVQMGERRCGGDIVTADRPFREESHKETMVSSTDAVRLFQ